MTILFQETFNNAIFFPLSGTTLNKTHGIENCNNNSVSPTGPNPWTLVNEGGKARFELRKGVLTTKLDYRSEVTIIKGSEDSRFTPEMWYAYDVMMPKDGGGPAYRKAINQWYEDGSDELTTRTENGFAYLELQNAGKTIRWDLFSVKRNDGASNTGFVQYPLDEWHQFVFHIIHSATSGLIEVWRDGVKIHEYRGATIHSKLPKWKIGLYASQKSTAEKEVIYFDNILVGDKSASSEYMIPSIVTPPPPPTTPTTPPTTPTPLPETVSQAADITIPHTETSSSITYQLQNLKSGQYTAVFVLTNDKGEVGSSISKVTVEAPPPPLPPPPVTSDGIHSFSFVDASTEKEIIDIDNNGVYERTKLSSRLSLLAKASNNVARVIFEVSGVQNFTKTDKAPPFYLHSDDGKGNVYSGNWDPAPLGQYQIKATPISFSGEALPPLTVSFKLV